MGTLGDLYNRVTWSLSLLGMVKVAVVTGGFIAEGMFSHMMYLYDIAYAHHNTSFVVANGTI